MNPILCQSAKAQRILQFLIDELELPCAEALSSLEVTIAVGEPIKVRFEVMPIDRDCKKLEDAT